MTGSGALAQRSDGNSRGSSGSWRTWRANASSGVSRGWNSFPSLSSQPQRGGGLPELAESGSPEANFFENEKKY